MMTGCKLYRLIFGLALSGSRSPTLIHAPLPHGCILCPKYVFVSIQHGFASQFCIQEVTPPYLRLNSHEDGRGSSTFLGEQVSTSAKQIYPKRDGTTVTASFRLLDASVTPPWTFLILSERTGRRTSWRFVEVVDFPQTCSSKSFLAMY